MFALLSFAAETSAESEPSKTAFYVAGALLVVFALAVSAIGVRSETFPPSRGGRVLVCAVAAVLVAAAMASAVLTS
jgi:hypothetical protein